MSVKFKKDLTRCLAHTKIDIHLFPGKYYKVFLWEDLDAMRANIRPDEGEEIEDGCIGMTCHNHYRLDALPNGSLRVKSAKYLGEIHFLRNVWDAEVVAHECFHATNNICKLLMLNPQLDIMLEERAAYMHGELVNDVYKWLWRVQPPKGAIRAFLRWIFKRDKF